MQSMRLMLNDFLTFCFFLCFIDCCDGPMFCCSRRTRNPRDDDNEMMDRLSCFSTVYAVFVGNSGKILCSGTLSQNLDLGLSNLTRHVVRGYICIVNLSQQKMTLQTSQTKLRCGGRRSILELGHAVITVTVHLSISVAAFRLYSYVVGILIRVVKHIGLITRIRIPTTTLQD